jgi:hypothetical protein
MGQFEDDVAAAVTESRGLPRKARLQETSAKVAQEIIEAPTKPVLKVEDDYDAAEEGEEPDAEDAESPEPGEDVEADAEPEADGAELLQPEDEQEGQQEGLLRLSEFQGLLDAGDPEAIATALGVDAEKIAMAFGATPKAWEAYRARVKALKERESTVVSHEGKAAELAAAETKLKAERDNWVAGVERVTAQLKQQWSPLVEAETAWTQRRDPAPMQAYLRSRGLALAGVSGQQAPQQFEQQAANLPQAPTAPLIGSVETLSEPDLSSIVDSLQRIQHPVMALGNAKELLREAVPRTRDPLTRAWTVPLKEIADKLVQQAQEQVRANAKALGIVLPPAADAKAQEAAATKRELNKTPRPAHKVVDPEAQRKIDIAIAARVARRG